MTKTVLTLVTFIALSMGSASAQSCCTKEKEACKPKVCCPTTPSCCEESTTSESSIDLNKNESKKTIINQEVAEIKEEAIIESNK